MKRLVASLGLAVLIAAIMLSGSSHVPLAHAQLAPTPTPTPTDQGNFSNFSSASEPTPTPERSNPFDYTPLPTNRGGPENDIVETSPITVSRSEAQVDDSINFSVTIKNQAPYHKHLRNVCFESTDGNFGCQFGVDLDSGQSVTLNNVGTWTNGGIKDIWITWSQDDINSYTPLNASTTVVNILG